MSILVLSITIFDAESWIPSESVPHLTPQQRLSDLFNSITIKPTQRLQHLRLRCIRAGGSNLIVVKQITPENVEKNAACWHILVIF